MKLLHPEVEILPGRPGTRQAVSPVPEGLPLPGSAVVRVTNTSSQNNAYTLQLRCENNPYWQETWYRLLPLPPAPGDRNMIPPGKRDELGPQGVTLKLYILSGGSREVLIQFNVPKSPEARAGRYPYTIEIETQVLNAPKETERREARITRLPGIALVRPFYNWSFDLKKSLADPKPGEPKAVGRLRPTGALEVILTNESNDWLYCDLLPPQPNDLLLECPTRRVALRPPEPGEVLTLPEAGVDPRPGTQRSVPLYATSQLKTLRGTPVVQAIPLTVVRVDAPTVAPSAEDDFFAGTGKVIARATTEKQTLPAERAIVYRPPIPATLTEFFRGAFSSGRTLVLSVIGIIAVAHVAFLMYEQIAYRNMHIALAESEPTPVPVGKPVRVTGKLLQGNGMQGTRFSVGNKDIDYRDIDAAHVRPVPNKPNEFELDLPTDSKLVGKSLTIRAQRFVGLLPYLTGLMPQVHTDPPFDYGAVAASAATQPNEVLADSAEREKTQKLIQPDGTITQVDPLKPGTKTGPNENGNGSNLPKQTPSITGQISGQHQVGDTLTIQGQNLGVSMGTVSLAGKSISPKNWDNNQISFIVSSNMPTDQSIPVMVQMPDGTQLQAGNFSLPPVPPSPASITGQISGQHQVGETLTIRGQNLGDKGILRVAGAPVNTTQWTGGQITFSVPGNMSTGTPISVEVQLPDNTRLQAGAFSVPAPVVKPQTPPASITGPISGQHQVGETLTIQGENMGGKGRIDLAGKFVHPTNWDTNRITFVVPHSVPTAISIPVTVHLPDGKRLQAGTFAVPAPTLPPPPASITSMTVGQLPTGTKVLSILGQNLGSSMGTVSLAGTSARVMKWNIKQIIVELTPSTPTGTQIPVTVKLPDNTQLQAGTFSIPAPVVQPQLASITVSVSGQHQVGETLTIQGQNLGDKGVVYLAGKRVRPSSWGGNQITFVVPPTVLTGQSITVEVRLPPNGTRLQAGAFSVPAPVVQPQTQPASITTLKFESLRSGKWLFIRGSNLGDSPGTVSMAGTSYHAKTWRSTVIIVPWPPTVPTDQSNLVEVQLHDGTRLQGRTISGPAPIPPTSTASVTRLFVRQLRTGGKILIIEGQNLGVSTGTVSLAGTPTRPMRWNSTQIIVPLSSTVPTGTQVPVEVQLADGTRLQGGTFAAPGSMVQPPTPPAASMGSITGPVSGTHRVGETLTIRGQNLGNSPGFILLGGKGFRTTSWSNNQITFVVPSNMPIGRTIMVMVQLSNRTRLQAGVFSTY